MKSVLFVFALVACMPIANAQTTKVSVAQATVKACQGYVKMSDDFPKASMADISDVNVTDTGKDLNVILFVETDTYNINHTVVHEKCQVQQNFSYNGALEVGGWWVTYCGY